MNKITKTIKGIIIAGAFVLAIGAIQITGSDNHVLDIWENCSTVSAATLGQETTYKLGVSTLTINVGVEGKFCIDKESIDTSILADGKTLSDVASARYYNFSSSYISVSQDGAFSTSDSLYGEAGIYVIYYDKNNNTLNSTPQSFKVYVVPDMSKSYLSETSGSMYITPSTAKVYKTGAGSVLQTTISNSPCTINISEYDSFITDNYSMTSSNANMKVTCTIYDNVVTFTAKNPGTTTVTIKLFNQTYTYKLTATYVKQKSSSKLMHRGQTSNARLYFGTTSKKSLKASSSGVIYSSSNSKVATVNADGKVKARKSGNCIIYAQTGNLKYAWAVSVTSTRKYKACKRAVKIYKSSTYSQAKRMSKGYYDCSSLVCRAYKPSGYYFGAGKNSTWAPVAADICKYLEKTKHKKASKCSTSNIRKMKFQAGDLLFKTGYNNNRYRGIYHVEMIIGYDVSYFDSKGRAVVDIKWATKTLGYGYSNNKDVILRP